ncbi:MAG: class I SAM-dependent methyltransferase [Paracoccaceae bacterium]
MAQSTKFWDRMAKRYARSPVSNQDAYQQKLKVTQQYFRPDMEVLEFGCGTGTTAITHSAYVKHIQAIDFSAKMLAIAQGKADAANIKNLTFRRSGIEDFEAPDESFDVIMGHSILHLLEDRDAVITRVFALLKPGGVFVSSTICMSGTARIMRFLLPIGHSVGLLPLVRFFSVDELVAGIQSAGFDIDHHWQPRGDSAVFIVAKKPG